MKCAYKYCQLGGHVEKEEAVKINGRYWHKQCEYENNMKREIRELYYSKFDSKEPAVAVNKAINKYIHEQNYEVGYVLYCLKYIAKKLNSLYGLSYSLSYKENYREYKKYVARHTKIDFNQQTDEEDIQEVVKIKPKEYKRWGDYF